MNVFRIVRAHSAKQSGIKEVKSLFCFSHSDQFADRISHGRKLFFVFSHYIAHRHNRIMMQVESVCSDGPAGFRNGFQRLIKKSPIIGFKFYSAVSS